MQNADFGMIGLAVMGANLALNMERSGFSVSAWDFTPELARKFAEGPGKGKNITVYPDLKDFVNSLRPPRRVMMMIRAGSPVDQTIERLLPLLDKGDVIIDGGNSHFPDTERRRAYVESKGLLYVGMGVSGGEEGALNGPSLMPGGSPAAWPLVKPVFQAICAKAPDGTPCCDWVGEGGAGHFVKMVHNGIEYGDMQLICEAYDLLRRGFGLNNEQMRRVFSAWNDTELDSYLVQITRDILGYRDEKGEYVVDAILDRAGQKGTGKWTGIAALEEGVPLTLITEAVFARCLSAMKEERREAAALYGTPAAESLPADEAMIEDLRQALLASKIVSYAQGYMLMRSAAQAHGWQLNYAGIAMLWRSGCIIRSVFLADISAAFRREPNLKNLLLDGHFSALMKSLLPAWRRTVARAVTAGVPVPAFSAALSWFDGYTSDRLPANLLQAQRDYFGAHTYERVDGRPGQAFHTDWTGRGAGIESGAYTV